RQRDSARTVLDHSGSRPGARQTPIAARTSPRLGPLGRRPSRPQGATTFVRGVPAIARGPLDRPAYLRGNEAYGPRIGRPNSGSPGTPIALPVAPASREKPLKRWSSGDDSTGAHELRQQNQEVAATQDVLEQERARYRALFELAPDAYLVTSLDGRI